MLQWWWFGRTQRRYTLGDKLQQQVAVTDHSLCSGSAIDCKTVRILRIQVRTSSQTKGLLRHALPISLLILRKKPTVLQSSSATSCSNMLRRHIATNRFVCTGEVLWKSLPLQQNFVAACNKSHKFCQIWFFATCCCDKILLQRQRFSQNFSSTHEAICPFANVSGPSCISSQTCRSRFTQCRFPMSTFEPRGGTPL